MEEAELLKVRLEAITNKRKVQEDIALKRRELDKEKLKLQHLKKKCTRDLWLMGDRSCANVQDVQKAQEGAQQTNQMQSNIHRIEKEIEALEREELTISMNENLILKRLQSVEKSTEEIIKAANANFKSEPFHVYSGNPQRGKSYTPLSLRKQPTPNSGAKTDQHKPALFAMEINVQKDLRTGESRVLSSSAVSPQELWDRGVKVYDDGRKSVYALCSDAGQPGANGVTELSGREVEELLKEATQKKKRLQSHGQPPSPTDHSRTSTPRTHHHAHCSNGCPQPGTVHGTDWSELRREVQYLGQELRGSAQKFRHYGGENYGKSLGQETYGAGPRHGSEPRYDFRDTQRGALHVDPDKTRRPPSSSDDSKPSILNVLPSDEPVTMIFMGYQSVNDNHHSDEGTVRAELVVIGEGEEDHSPTAAPYHHPRFGPHPTTTDTGITTPGRGSEGTESSPPATGSRKPSKVQGRRCCMLM